MSEDADDSEDLAGAESLVDHLSRLEDEGLVVRSYCMCYVTEDGAVGSVWNAQRTLDRLGLSHELDYQSREFAHPSRREGPYEQRDLPDEGRTFQ